MRTALVLGGGVAGIAAAFALRDRGFAVRLLESRRWLGGRAFSFADERLGMLDNGPHVLLGCYDRFRGLLRRLGTEGEFARAGSLEVAYRLPGGARARLRLPPGPVPLAMPLGLLRLPLGGGGRLRGLLGLLQVLRGAPAAWSLRQWIDRRRQTGAPEDFFWGPLCRAVMNAEPEEVSAALFLSTLRRAFLGRGGRGAIWIPRRPWGELLGAAAARRLREAGVAVELGCRVTGLTLRDRRVTAVAIAGGRSLEPGEDDLLVSALPWHALSRLLGDRLPLPAAGLPGSPLVTVYFRLQDPASAPALEGSLVALVRGQPFHFLYRRPEAPPQEFALLAGGSRSLDGRTVADIEQAARRQLGEFYPEFDPAVPAEVRVAKEAKATFVAAPASLSLRPAPGPLPEGPCNLLVCGDWTDCGLPSTLEGAALSAELCLAQVPPAPDRAAPLRCEAGPAASGGSAGTAGLPPIADAP